MPGCLLTDPGAYGHDPADSFDIVIPSLPGFGYSDKPKQLGTNFFRIAALGLRYGDRIIGIHLNYIPGSHRPHFPDGATLTSSEELFLANAAKWFDENGAYAHIQGTRPYTADSL